MVENALVAIPVFNEEQYVSRVLAETRRYDCDILVVDDGSTDGTADILRREVGIHVLTHAENRGYGMSLADAFCFAQKKDYEWLITMDCDEQHEPSCIPAFLQVASEGGVDVISGSRYTSGCTDTSAAPEERRAINRRITAILNERLGLSLTDAFCGFKAHCVASLAALRITIPGYAMPMQFWVQAARAKLRIRELPVPLIYNDPNRYFGGALDDPAVRMAHYLEVFEAELTAPPVSEPKARAGCLPCR